MNPIQFARQIRHQLESAVWPVDGGEPVFGSVGQRVSVVVGEPSEEQIPAATPWAMVTIGDAECDDESPHMLMQSYGIIACVEVAGDPLGEAAMSGSAVGSLAKSVGRGIGEVSAQVRAAVESLTGADGATVLLSGVSMLAPKMMGRRNLAMASLMAKASCTSATYYAAPQLLRWNSGSWLWDGSRCEARYDFLRYRLLRKLGTTPSISAIDGELLYTGTVSELVGVQESGYVYTVFADYDHRGGGVVHGTSSAEVGAYRIV